MTLLKELQDLEAEHGMMAIITALAVMSENHCSALLNENYSRGIQWGRVADELTLVTSRMKRFLVDTGKANVRTGELATPDDWTDGLSFMPDGTGRVD